MAKRKASLGCLFWLALVLLVVVIFLFNQKNIEAALRETGFLDVLQKQTEPMEVTINSPEAEDQEDREVPDKNNQNHDEPKEIVLTITDTQKKDQSEENRPKDTEPAAKMNNRKARIFFVTIKNNGGIELKSVIRSVQFDNAPLRETMLALLQGPLTSELNQGYLSVIPEGTAIKNIYVKSNKANIDFSEGFRFNALGQAGLRAQVKQVVFTATEFANVDSVQILIDGKMQTFLSPEGPFIGDPMTRDSFAN